jgi:hypothetical protein
MSIIFWYKPINIVFYYFELEILIWRHSFTCKQTSDLLDGKISLAHARHTHISQVIKSQNKIIYKVINYCFPIKVYYRICTVRHIRIKIIRGSQNVFWVLTWVGGY